MAKTSTLVIDSTKVSPEALVDIERILYGTPTEDPRLPLPAEVISIINRIGLLSSEEDAGTYDISYGSMVEDPDDPGTYLIVKDGVYEDPEDPGTYLTGEPSP